ncbi:hypothetical protein NESM_000231900 [Novymonas esmeraldas]|uniref:Uncharacterized protein n=1 Tax=Novymonas esmeraldas TaxID=1808958 RepID=A0AAW0F533_9TRYP
MRDKGSAAQAIGASSVVTLHKRAAAAATVVGSSTSSLPRAHAFSASSSSSSSRTGGLSASHATPAATSPDALAAPSGAGSARSSSRRLSHSHANGHGDALGRSHAIHSSAAALGGVDRRHSTRLVSLRVDAAASDTAGAASAGRTERADRQARPMPEQHQTGGGDAAGAATRLATRVSPRPAAPSYMRGTDSRPVDTHVTAVASGAGGARSRPHLPAQSPSSPPHHHQQGQRRQSAPEVHVARHGGRMTPSSPALAGERSRSGASAPGARRGGASSGTPAALARVSSLHTSPGAALHRTNTQPSAQHGHLSASSSVSPESPPPPSSSTERAMWSLEVMDRAIYQAVLADPGGAGEVEEVPPVVERPLSFYEQGMVSRHQGNTASHYRRSLQRAQRALLCNSSWMPSTTKLDSRSGAAGAIVVDDLRHVARVIRYALEAKNWQAAIAARAAHAAHCEQLQRDADADATSDTRGTAAAPVVAAAATPVPAVSHDLHRFHPTRGRHGPDADACAIEKEQKDAPPRTDSARGTATRGGGRAASPMRHPVAAPRSNRGRTAATVAANADAERDFSESDAEAGDAPTRCDSAWRPSTAAAAAAARGGAGGAATLSKTSATVKAAAPAERRSSARPQAKASAPTLLDWLADTFGVQRTAAKKKKKVGTPARTPAPAPRVAKATTTTTTTATTATTTTNTVAGVKRSAAAAAAVVAPERSAPPEVRGRGAVDTTPVSPDVAVRGAGVSAAACDRDAAQRPQRRRPPLQLPPAPIPVFDLRSFHSMEVVQALKRVVWWAAVHNFRLLHIQAGTAALAGQGRHQRTASVGASGGADGGHTGAAVLPRGLAHGSQDHRLSPVDSSTSSFDSAAEAAAGDIAPGAAAIYFDTVLLHLRVDLWLLRRAVLTARDRATGIVEVELTPCVEAEAAVRGGETHAGPGEGHAAAVPSIAYFFSSSSRTPR